GGTEYRGDRYTNGWSTPNPPTYDAVNTVEQVEVQTPEIGVWTVNVIGTTVPSTARFAVVIAADVGPQEQYKVDLTPQAPTAFSVAPGGSAVFPFSILNYGTDQDTVDLTTTAPASLTVNFLPSNSYFLDSGESVNAFAIVSANPAATPGVYAFDIKGTSFNDPSVSDFIPLTVEVLNAPLPNPLLVTNLTVDELDPSVVAFRDGTVGGHIFIVYRRSTAVQSPPNDYLGGVNVWVAHALLDANGLPILPFDYRAISGMNDQPNDLRVIRIPSGTYANRIIVTWTGIDPNGTTDQAAWGRVAYLDAGAGPSYYTGSWQVRTIEINYGSQFSNAARVSFPLFRQASPDPEGELYWVWEHLDSDSGGTLQSVRTNMIRSQDGGDTWPACGLWSPTNINCILISPDNTNYYFFPNGVVDQNDVAWIFFYWRTSGGNDRDLNVRLYNGLAGTATPYAAASMSGAINIYDTTDNVQWPAAVSIDPDGGATNRVYFVVTRDECGVDLNMYVAYAEGLYSSTSPPTAILNPGGSCPTLNANLSPSFTLVSPAGGLGTSISNANYNRRPILNIVGTVDAGPSTTVWLPVMENSNPYNQPNLWSWYTNPGFAQGTMSKITADAFAKGHQMSSTLTSGTVGRVYEVWHANKGGVTGVNYNVYLAIYSKNWEGAADTEGPVVPWQGTVPPIVNLTQGSSFEVLANINDISTGNSDIQSAEYQIDGGAWTPLNPVDAFDSPAEGARATADASSLLVGMHTLCVRGTDVVPNLGTAVCTFFEVAGASPGDIIPPDPPTVTGAVLSGGSNADVDVRWDASPDEGVPGGTVEYRILRATAIAGPYNQIGLVLAAMLPSYTYTCVACGHGDVTNYFFKIRAADNVSNVADATAIAAKYTVAVRQGTNLLSVPLQQADWSVAEVLQTVSFDRVRAYRGAQADPWKAWYAGRPGDLTAFQFNDAFWVTTTAAGRYTIAGLVQNTPSVALVSGWNLVGYADWVGETASASLTLLSWTRVETFDAAAPAAPYNLRRVLGSETLVGGQAYWVFLTAAGNWVQG
ncbi:MAG TPA: hypothetical protein VJ397_06320, partial [Thermoplasmata archaeon]|nr:hypothetical protein [Thermoplasmata archaeon]